MTHPLRHQCPIDNPGTLCPGFLLDLQILTLSPSDPLSRWASSGQQPQQQHIPTWALPSSKRPWHCLALLSGRQTLPAPGLRLVRIGGHRACSPGAPAPERSEWFVWFFVLLFSRYSYDSHIGLPFIHPPAGSPSPPHPILSTRKRAHSSTIYNTHHQHSETVPA